MTFLSAEPLTLLDPLYKTLKNDLFLNLSVMSTLSASKNLQTTIYLTLGEPKPSIKSPIIPIKHIEFTCTFTFTKANTDTYYTTVQLLIPKSLL